MKSRRFRKWMAALLIGAMLIPNAIPVYAVPVDDPDLVVDEVVQPGEPAAPGEETASEDVVSVDDVAQEEITDAEDEIVSGDAVVSEDEISVEDEPLDLELDFLDAFKHPVMKKKWRPEGVDRVTLADHGDGEEPESALHADIPARYVVPKEYITPLRNQDIWGTCFAHGAIASIESYALKNNLVDTDRTTTDFSELHLAYAENRSDAVDPLGGTEGDTSVVNAVTVNNDGYLNRMVPNDVAPASLLTDKEESAVNFLSSGGANYNTAKVLANWAGVVNESFAPYAEDSTIPVYEEKLNEWKKWVRDDLAHGNETEYKRIGNEILQKYYNDLSDGIRTYMYNHTMDYSHMKKTYEAEDELLVLNSRIIPKLNSQEDVDMLKTMIMENGVIDISYYAADEDKDPNSTLDAFVKGSSYFCPIVRGANHEVAVVGWDDGYPKENFNNSDKIKNDGAWLFRNSWLVDDDQIPEMDGDRIVVSNTEGGNGNYSGYFWISYEDPNICDITSFMPEKTGKYDNNYTYAGGSATLRLSMPDKFVAATIHKAAANDAGECLKAVNVYVQSSNTHIQVDIYRNPIEGQPMTGKHVASATTERFADCMGTYNVELKQPVYLKKGDTFATVVTLTKEGSDASIAAEAERLGASVSTLPGRNFVLSKGEWFDLSEMSFHDFEVRSYTANGTEAGISYINYQVEGGYDENNPYYYKAGDRFELKDPVLEDGNLFDGWYLDPEYTKPITEFTSEIAGGKDITLYAKVESAYNIVVDLATKEKTSLPQVAKTREDGRSYKILTDPTSKKIATLNSAGVVAGKKAGVALFTVKKGEKEYKVTVQVVDPKFTQKQYKMNSGEGLLLPYDPCGRPTKFSIPEKQQKLAIVDEHTGLVSALNGVKGTVTVTATVGEGRNARKVSAKVKIFDPKIALPKDGVVQVGKTIKAKMRNGSGTTEWSVENGTGNATIDAKGTIVSIKAGEVTVIGKNNGRTCTAKVTIVQ